jgi:hypothetical protein
MEQDVPSDLAVLKPWFPAIRHCISVAKQSSGLGVLTLRIVINYGKPFGLWIMPELTRLVPRDTADQALKEIIYGLTDDASLVDKE